MSTSSKKNGRVEQTPVSLEHALSDLKSHMLDIQNKVPWAASAHATLQIMEELRSKNPDLTASSDPETDFQKMLRSLELYAFLDIAGHMASGKCRTPYYLGRLESLLELASRSLSNEAELCHVMNHLRVLVVDHGFCRSVDCGLVDGGIDEDNQLEPWLHTIDLKISNLEQDLVNRDRMDPVAISDLKHIAALKGGLELSITANLLEKYASHLTGYERKIHNLANKIAMRRDSATTVNYLAHYHALSKDKFQSSVELHESEPALIERINSHLLHPSTRAWVLEKFERFLLKSKKRLFFAFGKTGTGKTCLSAAISKLYGRNVVANYFFDDDEESDNSVNGMIMAVVAGLMRSLPEYLNIVDDLLGDSELKPGSTWKETYNLLLKKPLRAIYGKGNAASNLPNPSRESAIPRRKLIVLDGIDKCNCEERSHLTDFLQKFQGDFSSRFCLFLTCRSEQIGTMLPDMQPPPYDDEDDLDGVQFEVRPWTTLHIRDIENYTASCYGAILSQFEGGRKANVIAPRFNVDERRLYVTLDHLMRHSSGKFSHAQVLMEALYREMVASKGQLHGSLIRAVATMGKMIDTLDDDMIDFATVHRPYRQVEGTSVGIRILKQNYFPTDKTRLTMIRSTNLEAP